ncbi:unnamed protein product [marine sediment metagenome]|uniref:Uncharacterized protein n=1 Tax=marine sediment metagenome TaxID=412755 RepID=X1Q2A3_9ZZZZ
MSKNSEYVICPLCGATVPKAEIQKYGYCETCRLLIEALTAKS